MKILLKIFFLFFLIFEVTYSQPLFWQRIYGLNELKEGISGVETLDGGFLISGKWDPGSSNNNMILIKTNRFGQTQWEKNYFVTDPVKIIQLSDSNFLSVGGGINGAGIFKIKNNGDSIWYKEFGNNGDAKFLSVKEQSGYQGYIVCGKKPITSFSEGGYLIKIDTSSNTIWENTLSDTKYNIIYANDLIIESNGNSIITGLSFDQQLKLGDPFICKINDSGNLYFSKFIKTSIQNDGGERIIKSYDNQYIISGYGIDNTSLTCAQFLKIDSLGKILIIKNFSGCTNLIEKTVDGNYMLGGYIQTPDGLVQLGLRKIDQEGNNIWQKTLKNCYSKTFSNDFESNSLGGYFIVGYYRDTTIQFDTRSIYVAKTDAEGNTSYPVKLSNNIIGVVSTTFDFFPAFPNPFNYSISFRYFIDQNGFIDLNIYNINGQLKKKIENSYKEKGLYNNYIDLNEFPSGIYFVKLLFQGRQKNQKIILVK